MKITKPDVFAKVVHWFTRHIYEKYAPDAVLDPEAPNHWQEKVLYLFILLSVFVGFLAYVLGIFSNITYEYWRILAACTIGYLISLIIFFFPKSPFALRAGLVCLCIYLIGMSIVLTVGPFYSSREWLFSFAIIAAILLRWPGAIASTLVNMATWGLIAVLIHIGYWDSIFGRAQGMHHWAMIVIDLLFIIVSTTILITMFFFRIDESDRSAKTYSKLLLAERDKLSNSNEKLAQEIEDRKVVTQALKESEEKYRTILETIADAYFEVDLRGNIIFFNRALIERLGYSRDELIGMNFRALMDQPNSAKIRDVFKNILVTGKPSPPVDLDIISAGGTEITVSVLASQISNAGSQAVGFRGLARDVTEYKIMESRLQRARKMEALGTLAGGVAHDLNNTLSGVVSYPELLLLNMPETDPMRKPITDIMKSGQKAAAIVQDLLALARRGVAVKEIANLNDVIHDYLHSPEFFNLRATHSGVRFETHLEPGLMNLSGSPVHLSKTLMNLVINAAEAIDTTGTVTITTENKYIEAASSGYDNLTEGDYVVLKVQDNGVGIPVENLENIFEPFFTKKVMGRSGTGLGMAVVWGTVEDHGGRIDVESTEGQGTTFTITFPATEVKATRKETDGSIEQLRGGGQRILVVDDVETQRDIATQILAALGYAPVAAKSGEEAVELIKTQSYDLILLDMIMRPGMDGLETYRRIIALRPGQKAVIASGFSETERVREAQGLGAGAYIKKPYSIEKVGLAIKKELAAS